jgi:hypothetical protein
LIKHIVNKGHQQQQANIASATILLVNFSCPKIHQHHSAISAVPACQCTQARLRGFSDGQSKNTELQQTQGNGCSHIKFQDYNKHHFSVKVLIL